MVSNLKVEAGRSPRISIVMCTYNGERFLASQLESIIQQTVPAWELVVYDDGSTDRTIEIIQDFFARAAGSEFRLIIGSQNVGPTRAFENAMAAARGDYIALADQDDVWAPDKLEHILNEIGNVPRVDKRPRLFVGSVILADGGGFSSGQIHPGTKALARKRAIGWRDLALGNLVPGCSMVFERSALAKILPIPDEAVLHDWWIALCFACIGEVIYVPNAVMYYRIHGANERGVPSFRKVWAACLLYGAVQLAANNFAHALLQLRKLRDRLSEVPDADAKCDGLASLCALPSVSPLLRPFRILNLGISRRSRLHTAMSCVASLFVTEKLVLTDEERFI